MQKSDSEVYLVREENIYFPTPIKHEILGNFHKKRALVLVNESMEKLKM
jgi:hypothetical protein